MRGLSEGACATKAIDRISTGIPRLDEMIGGGLPTPSLTLVAGDVGSGKTTLSMQFLFKGAELCDPGIYFMTFGGPPEWAFRFLSTYEFVRLEYFGKKIRCVDLGEGMAPGSSAEDLLDLIHSELQEFRPRRIVLETPSVMKDILGQDYRLYLLRLAAMVKEERITALVTGESEPGSLYPVDIAHIADGVILLHNEELNLVRRRSLEILKMRGTSHISGKHAVDISAKGLMVYPGL
jgi:circadian clock protein KaiC